MATTSWPNLLVRVHRSGDGCPIRGRKDRTPNIKRSRLERPNPRQKLFYRSRERTGIDGLVEKVPDSLRWGSQWYFKLAEDIWGWQHDDRVQNVQSVQEQKDRGD